MKDVVMYSTQSCTYCNKAKDFFAENNVAYTVHDVGTDIDKRKEMVEKTGQMGVPVIVVGEDVVVGFDEAHLRQLLDLQAA